MDDQSDSNFQHLQVKAGILLTKYENGGKCKYCGQGLALKEYNWVIEGYR